MVIEPGSLDDPLAGLDADGAIFDKGQRPDAVPLGLEDLVWGVKGLTLGSGLHRLQAVR